MSQQDFIEPPRKMAREYAQHLLLVALDGVFLICWAFLMGGCHLAVEWIDEKIGLGAIDQVFRWCFEAVFGLTTFFWVIRTVWRVHREAYARAGRKPRATRRRENEPQA